MHLLIETSTERAMVAIVKGDQLLFHKDLPFGYQQSRHLLPAIEAGLTGLKMTMGDIEAVGVGTGPGSYTGMRVGAMTAKALAYARAIPLVGICTLHTFVGEAVLIDAKIGGVYLAIDGGNPQVCALEEAEQLLKNTQTLVTPNATQLKLKLAQHNWKEAAPDPLQMAALVSSKLNLGQFSLDGQLELIYLRSTSHNF